MIEGVGGHRLHDGDVVHDFGQMRQRLGKFRAAPAVPGELEFAGEQRRVRFDERVFLAHHNFFRHGLAVVFGEGRLVIEQIELARRAAHEQVDDPLRFRLELRLSGRQGCRAAGQAAGAERAAGIEQRRERNRAESDAALTEEPAAGDELGGFVAEFVRLIHKFCISQVFGERSRRGDFARATSDASRVRRSRNGSVRVSVSPSSNKS